MVILDVHIRRQLNNAPNIPDVNNNLIKINLEKTFEDNIHICMYNMCVYSIKKYDKSRKKEGIIKQPLN